MKSAKKFLMKLLNLHTVPKVGTLSGKTPPQSNGVTNPTPVQVITQVPALFHQSCKTLIYDTFVKITCEELTRQALVISGNPTEDELATAWDAITQEYSDLIQTPKSNNIFELWKKIEQTELHQTYIRYGLWLLKREYNQQIAEQIANYGYDYIQPLEPREAYLKQIYAVETETKILTVLYNQYVAEYNLICPPGTEHEKRDLMSYEKELAIISRDAGQRIDKTAITVFEYCAKLNAYFEANNVKRNA